MNRTPHHGAARRAVPALLSALVLVTLHVLGLRADAARKPKPATEGSLRAVSPDGRSAGLCPLRHTRVRAEVSGFVARVNVTQEFTNPFDEKIEAVYVFPLPQGAAVDDMTMRVGERTIKGQVMRRAEARATYEQAKERGQVASLLDQERPNVFTQSVANIMPGEDVTVTISYVELLKYEAGTYEWTFPMVVGERYIPAKSRAAKRADESGDRRDEDGGAAVGDSRASDHARLNPPRVPSGMRAGHEVSVEVLLDAGVPLEGVVSKTHEIEAEQTGARRTHVRLKEKGAIPNKDFVLRYDVSGGRIEDAVLAHRSPADPRGGFFTIILQPPDRVAPSDAVPKELVFVLDTSGSMEGFPLDKAKETIKLALDGLYPTDTFNLITFSGDEHVLFPEPVPATPENLRLAKKFISAREGGGGTEMMSAIRAALDPSDSQAHVRVVCFMTDGHVGNDFEIIAEVQKHRNARVFSMGFGDSPNRFLLDKMAEEGRGEVEYVAEGDDGSKAARRFHERVRNPLLTDIAVEWHGLAVEDVYPERPPDLFAAKPVAITGRYLRGGAGRIVLRGRAAGREFAREIAVVLPEDEARNDALRSLWARLRVDDLMRHDYAGAQDDQMREDLREQITQLGLDFRLMTQFTSFVAVDESSRTTAGAPLRVDVPAEQPLPPTPAPASPVTLNLSAAGGQGMNVGGGGPGGGGGGSLPPGYVGGVAETVTVTSSADTIESTATSLSTAVESRSIANLPLHARAVLNLLYLAPGVVAPTGAAGLLQSSVNGQRPTANDFTVDGLDADAALPAGGVVSQEAAQEFAVRSRATEGRAPGAQVNVVTRAGTNEWRGSLYEFFGHERLDANDWFANSRGLARAPHRENLFGGTLGGPVRRDQTFFFLSYEGLRLRRPGFAIADVPSLDARAGAPTAVRPFLEAFPVPTGAARADGFAEFASGHSSPARLDSGSLRLDHCFGDRVALFARYGIADAVSEARGVGGFSTNTLSALARRSHAFASSFTYMPNSSAVVTLRAGYSRSSLRNSTTLADFGGASASPFAGSYARADAPAGERLSVFDLNGRGAALSSGARSEDARRRLHLAAEVAAAKGDHSTKLGADYRRTVISSGRQISEESVLFDVAAGALTGDASRIGLYERDDSRRAAFDHFSLHAHDEWRKTPRLTLTGALRWELAPAPSPRDSGGLFSVARLLDPLRLAEDARPWRTSFLNFAPRAGAAYLLREASGRELILRGGVGLYYDADALQSADAFGGLFPLRSARVVFDSPFTSFGSGGEANESGAASPSSSPTGVPVAAFDQNFALPYAWQWNATAQQTLGRGSTLSASYVGAAGRRLLFAETLLAPAQGLPYVRLARTHASSDYHALQLQFDRRLGDGLAASAAYTWAKSLDDAGGSDTHARALLRSSAPRGERGPSDFDVRHLLAASVSYELPSPFSSGLGRAVSRGWSLDAIFNARSRRPINVVFAVPTVYGFAYLRPDLLSGVPLYLEDDSAAGGRRINPLAFVPPSSQRQGTLGRNALRGFAFSQLDAALRRSFKLSEHTRLQIGAEAFNLLNRPNFEDPEGAGLTLGGRLSPAGRFVPSGTFGRSLSLLGRGQTAAGNFEASGGAGGPRTLRLLVKLEF
jgi:Ca-activated chloride channel family protein